MTLAIFEDLTAVTKDWRADLCFQAPAKFVAYLCLGHNLLQVSVSNHVRHIGCQGWACRRAKKDHQHELVPEPNSR